MSDIMDAAAEIMRLREALRGVVEAWDWWQVDTYDRCQSVPSDAIAEARAALAPVEAAPDDVGQPSEVTG